MSNIISTLSFEQKSALLRAALLHPFTSTPTKSAYLGQIFCQLEGQFTLEQVEKFFGEVVDFEALEAVTLNKNDEKGVVIANDHDHDNNNTYNTDNTDNTDNFTLIESKSIESLNPQLPEPERLEFFEETDQRTPSPANSLIISQSNSSSSSSPKSLASTPLLVPVRTPSGRTLRSNSTVNTSEPRRLRSNK